MAGIACIAWESVIWDSRELPLAGSWNLDGPALPLEFARTSRDGRLILVLLDNAALIPTAWCLLNVRDIEEAAEALRQREGPTRKQWIGRWSPRHPDCRPEVCAWAEARGLIGAVWTALPPKWDGVDGRAPTLEQAVQYLAQLDIDQQRLAMNYVRRAPSFDRTRYREAFEDQLGWLADASTELGSLG